MMFESDRADEEPLAGEDGIPREELEPEELERPLGTDREPLEGVPLVVPVEPDDEREPDEEVPLGTLITRDDPLELDEP